MTTKKPISPFLVRALSSNGDSSSEDDDVFLNSRLDVISRNCEMDHHLDFHNPNSTCFLHFKMDEHSVSSLFTPSPKGDEGAVIFSVYLCGKYYGEVGLFEPDISILDWVGFKSYIFSSLNLESFDSYIISYCDEEGDKLPIESEDDYQEALKIAKFKSGEEEKFLLYITRIGGGFPNSLRSLVSSSLRRVNSVGGSKSNISTHPQKRDVTTSTSFQSFGNENSNSLELNSEEISSFVPLPHTEELSSPQENYFGETNHIYDKNFYDCLSNNPQTKEQIPRSYSAFPHTNVSNWNRHIAANNDSMSSVDVPAWFNAYMKQFKDDLSHEVSSKIEERFDEAVGNISATDVETKLRGLLTGYSSELQNKVLCCCKASNEHCQSAPSPVCIAHQTHQIDSHNLERMELSTPHISARLEHREDSVDGDEGNNQDYFIQKLLKREQEILDFLDNTNEKIKEKIRANSDYTDSLRVELAIEKRERVLARIEDFRQRQNRTTNDIKMLQQTMEGNNEGIARLALQDFIPPKDYDAKFIRDESFVDGSKVEPNQNFTKQWAVQNSGLKAWNFETFLVCQTQAFHRMKPSSASILCPPLTPGEIGVLSADFIAPSFPGIFSTEWRFIQGDKLFGNHLWCTVIVPPKSDPSDIVPAKSEILLPESSSSCQPETLSESDMAEFRNHRRFILKNMNPLKFEMDSAENLAHRCKETLRSMNAEEVLLYLMYVIRITKPNFSSIKKEMTPVFLSKFLSRGLERDFDNLCEVIDQQFVEKCAREKFPVQDVENCYRELFMTGFDVEKFRIAFNQMYEKFINNAFTFQTSSDEEELDEDAKQLEIANNRENEPNAVDYDLNQDAEEAHNEKTYIQKALSLNVNGQIDDDEEFECESLVSVSAEEDSDEGDDDEDDDDDDEDDDDNDENDDINEDNENGEINEDNDNDDINNDNENDVEDDEPDHVVEDSDNDVVNDEAEGLVNSVDHNQEINFDPNSVLDLLPEMSVIYAPSYPEMFFETRVKKLNEEEKGSLNKVHDDDCEDECSSVYTEYSESDSYLESDEEEPLLDDPHIVDATTSKNQVECMIEPEVEKEKEVMEEKEMDRAHSSSLETNHVEEHIKRVPGTELKKNITSLHENFKQNVEVRLDFEVISRISGQEEQKQVAPSLMQTNPLTFQEKHFTVSSRPPPDPVQVRDSDEESFDGMVFIKDTDVPSSVPPTEPCSPSNPPPINPPLLDESERSPSCSSFSECDEEELDDPEGVANPIPTAETAESSIHESESTDIRSETSSPSAIVDQATSVYYESSLPDACLEHYFSIRSESRRDDSKCLKSPDTNIDSGSSSHTLKDVAASESSGSYDVNEPPAVELTQEESTSEFEYVANADN